MSNTFEFKIDESYRYTDKFAEFFEITLDDVFHACANNKKYFTELIELSEHKPSIELESDLSNINNNHMNMGTKSIV